MQPYRNILAKTDIAALAAFVESELIGRKPRDMRYHSPENGWPDHDRRYGAAYPFVLGRISMEVPVQSLSEANRAGRLLYRESCSICHEPALEPRPRRTADGGDHYGGGGDYHDHTDPPVLTDPNPAAAEGMRLYQANCAYCHAADGSGGNWIGRFLEPHPTDLTSAEYSARFTAGKARRVVERGLDGTSMPAFGAVLSENEIDAIVAYMDTAFVRR